jgi:hypothetical protein
LGNNRDKWGEGKTKQTGRKNRAKEKEKQNKREGRTEQKVRKNECDD